MWEVEKTVGCHLQPLLDRCVNVINGIVIAIISLFPLRITLLKACEWHILTCKSKVSRFRRVGISAFTLVTRSIHAVLESLERRIGEVSAQPNYLEHLRCVLLQS